MTVAVEAGSLSSITHIAANPPRRIDDYQQAHTRPLVLYIARVPGRRDVFLTPIKPREKVVTAEDVQSSLYYVHINSDDDTDIISRSTPYHTAASKISLLDYDQTAHQSSSSAPWSTTDACYSTQYQPPIPELKPVLLDITNSRPRHIDTVQGMPLLPPRPLSNAPVLSSPPHNLSQHSDWSHLTGYSGTRRTSQQSQAHRLALTPAEVDFHEALSGTLTVIRRDPATSDQWNVAHIRNRQPILGSSEAAFTPYSKNSNKPIEIAITNPAYFCMESDVCNQNPDSAYPGPHSASFSRLLQSRTSPTFDHNDESSIHSHGRSSISSDRQSFRRRSLLTSAENITNGTRRRSQTYSFFSPWNGYCSFTTTTAGHSLKCTHQLPDRERSLPVSELRFHLPHSSSETVSTGSTSTKRHSRLDALHDRLRFSDNPNRTSAPLRPQTNDDRDEATSLMDLSLGQEHAGGGFGGKQAKLGKLIIWPDGIPMLDLLVAANMALWWKAWERAT